MQGRFWSEQAQSDFKSLFEDRAYSPAFQNRVAQTLIRGWPPNRDKPFWVIALLVSLLGNADEQTATRRTGQGGGRGLDLLSLEVVDILQTLKGLPQDTGHFTHDIVDGQLVVEALDLRVSLGRGKIILLRKITEFLICCDDYKSANDVIAILDELAETGLSDTSAFKDNVQKLARLFYEYRKEHFYEGHAGSGFDFVHRFFASLKDEPVTDNLVLDLWQAEENTYFKTYRSTLNLFLHYSNVRSELQERAKRDMATSMNDNEAVDRIGSIPDQLRDDPSISARILEVESYSSGTDEDDGEPGFKDAQSSDLKLFTQADYAFLELVASIWPGCEKFGLSLYRLAAFHPIQSGLSNTLRTGRSKVPIEERVTCQEAEQYGEIAKACEALASKARDWMKVNLALKMQNAGSDAHQDLVEQGIAILKTSRSKSFQKPSDILEEEFDAVRDDLIAISSMLEGASELFRTLERTNNDDGLIDQFNLDKAVFAAEFSKRYLENGTR